MNQYSTFIFESYSWHPETGIVDLHYSLDASTGLSTGDEIKFTERLRFPLPAHSVLPDPMALQQALFALHLIGGVSYYKTCLPKTIEVRSGTLTTEQAEFWSAVYENGLGEFFYKNDIDFRGIVAFPHPHPRAPSPLRGRGGVAIRKDSALRSYRPSTVEFARTLRQHETPAETILWDALRKNAFHGLHFRRQHPIGKYILDFYCDSIKLGIEIDGAVHDGVEQQEKDADRTDHMRAAGMRIVRVRNDEIFANVQHVLKIIEKYVPAHCLNEPLPPLPRRGEEGGGGGGAPPSPANGGGGSGVGVLVPVGGGKDSVVTWELLRSKNVSPALVRLGGHALIDRVAKIADLHLMTIDRHLAPELFTLNAEGALNGHVPITAYLQFATLFLALLHGERAVVMSNERSANEGNVEYRGKIINHQWSKSLEFERMFQDYVSQNITTDISVFSLLRPMSELKIVELFSRYPQYFNAATSCNANWKILKKSPICHTEPVEVRQMGTSDNTAMVRRAHHDRTLWCGTCPKCTFVFACMAAFLDQQTLTTMFNKNLFADSSLLPLYKQLLGLDGFKPFECVGTPEETAAAFLLARKKGNYDDTPVMQMFIKEKLPKISDPKKLIDETLRLNNEHAIPEEFSSILSL